MYFYGRRHLFFFNGDGDLARDVERLFPEIQGARINQVEAEFKYWRKANSIHKWFVENVQEGVDECQESFVHVKKLYELRDICEQVIANPDQAPHLLPTSSGSFFGSTDYNEWFFKDVEETLNWLNDFLLKETMGTLKNWDFYYRASW